MWGLLAELGVFFGIGALEKRAATRGLAILGKYGIEATEKTAGKELLRIARRGTGSLGRTARVAVEAPAHLGAESSAALVEMARTIRLAERAGRMELSRVARSYAGYRAANTLAWSVPMIHQGISMMGGLGDLFARTPKPSQQMLQANMMAMPRAAYTQRQAAMQAIHNSQMTTRAAIGQEAAYMHR